MTKEGTWGRLSKPLIIAFLALAVVGFADAAYLTAEHIRGGVPPCSVVHGCEQVLTSEYATVGSMPVSAFGMGYYVGLIILMVAFLDTGNRRFIHVAAWLTTAGLLATVYLVGVMAFVIKAFCQYCLVSAATTVALFIIATVIMRRD